MEDDTKFKGTYCYVTVEVNGKIRRVDEYYGGRGQDRADAYVDALYDHSGWTIDLDWIDRADAKRTVKNTSKTPKPLPHSPKQRIS